MKIIKVISLLIGLALVSGCTTKVWKTYKPPMENLVGMNAKLLGEELRVGSPVQFNGGKTLEIITRESTTEESEVSKTEVNAALEVLVEKVSLKLGVNVKKNFSVSASNVVVDMIKNWAWTPEGQTFIYGGLRAETVTIELKTDKALSVGEISYPEIGTLDISAKSDNNYTVTIKNPKVYYKIQMAKVKKTFSDQKYSNGWITMNSLGKTNIEPIILSELTFGSKETWKRQPYQSFFDRTFSSYDMPQLSLVIEKGNLYMRSTRGLDSKLISLDKHKSVDTWNKDSIFIMDFPVGEFKRKFVVLDLKAKKDGDRIIIKHARIRYPEIKLVVE